MSGGSVAESRLAPPASRVSFTVLGEPVPQGSLRSLGAGRPTVASNRDRLDPWRQAVAARAVAAMGKRDVRTGPLRLRVVFVFDRPRSHYGTGRNADRLKASAPLYVAKRPDVDKLLRAVGDALTGIVWRDDSQLVDVTAEKHYGSPACAHVVIDLVDPDDDRAGPDPLA